MRITGERGTDNFFLGGLGCIETGGSFLELIYGIAVDTAKYADIGSTIVRTAFELSITLALK
jgi:hypothetical protein